MYGSAVIVVPIDIYTPKGRTAVYHIRFGYPGMDPSSLTTTVRTRKFFCRIGVKPGDGHSAQDPFC